METSSVSWHVLVFRKQLHPNTFRHSTFKWCENLGQSRLSRKTSLCQKLNLSDVWAALKFQKYAAISTLLLLPVQTDLFSVVNAEIEICLPGLRARLIRQGQSWGNPLLSHSSSLCRASSSSQLAQNK